MESTGLFETCYAGPRECGNAAAWSQFKSVCLVNQHARKKNRRATGCQDTFFPHSGSDRPDSPCDLRRMTTPCWPNWVLVRLSAVKFNLTAWAAYRSYYDRSEEHTSELQSPDH